MNYDETVRDLTWLSHRMPGQPGQEPWDSEYAAWLELLREAADLLGVDPYDLEVDTGMAMM